MLGDGFSANAATQPVLARRALQAAQRAELVEVLDRVVAGEHEFQAVYGRFTRVIGQTGVSIPLSLVRAYEIVVTEATSDRLRVNALSEWNGQTEDVATIDQDFSLHASFVPSSPRPEYLKVVALRNLRAHRDPVTGELPAADPSMVLPADGELTLFQGYFDYFGGPHPVAIGKRAPVLGIRVDEDPPVEAQGPAPEQSASIAGTSGDRTPAASDGPVLARAIVKVPTQNVGLEIERLSGDH